MPLKYCGAHIRQTKVVLGAVNLSMNTKSSETCPRAHFLAPGMAVAPRVALLNAVGVTLITLLVSCNACLVLLVLGVRLYSPVPLARSLLAGACLCLERQGALVDRASVSVH